MAFPASLGRQDAPLAAGWYPLCSTREVEKWPKRFLLSGLPYVAYRVGSEMVVLEDRCPHRNAPLSRGRLVGECIECPYHGWRFDSSGQCTEIPGLRRKPKTAHRVRSFPNHVAFDILFVGVRVAANSSPLSFAPQRDARYQHRLRRVVFPASLLSVAENALDVPHTSVLHRGLFRTARRNRVTAFLQRFSSFVEAEYRGEPAPGGLLGRVLSAGSDRDLAVTHFDRFYLPGVIQIEYSLGTGSHLMIVGYLKEEQQGRTELFAHLCLRTPLFGWLERIILFLVEPFARLIVAQDQRVLGQQGEVQDAFGGPRYMSTDIDLLYSSMVRLLKEGSALDEANYDFDADRAQGAKESAQVEMES